jgi:hypothetical protein
MSGSRKTECTVDSGSEPNRLSSSGSPLTLRQIVYPFRAYQWGWCSMVQVSTAWHD